MLLLDACSSSAHLRYIELKKLTSLADGDRRDVVPDSAFTAFRARVNAHLARAPTALLISYWLASARFALILAPFFLNTLLLAPPFSLRSSSSVISSRSKPRSASKRNNIRG